MSAYHESYHTHTGGREFGWWGVATHPGHLDLSPVAKIIQGTEWRVEAQADTLEDVIKAVRDKTRGKLHGGQP